MANQWYQYRTEDGGSFYIQAEENVVALYEDIVKTYDESSAVAATAPTPESEEPADEDKLPSSIQVRRLNLQIPGFGQGILPVFSNIATNGSAGINGQDWAATLQVHGLCEASDPESPLFPVDVSTEGDLTVQCIGFAGERRLSN